MIKTLQRAAVVTAALFALSPAVAGVAYADPELPDDPEIGYPCPPEGCDIPPIPPFELNCPPLCLDDPELTVPPQFPCPPVCVDPGPEDDNEVVPICPPICPGPDDGEDFVPVCPPICPPDPDDGDDPDGGADPGDGGEPGDDGGEPGDDGGEPSDEPSDDPTPDDGGQPQGSNLPKTGGPDVPLMLASGIGLIAAGGFGYLLVARRH